ncbi:trehalose-phosphatase [Herbaspirillum autotrophicum]|uniref:trehalose-phosphatase n=1 Tax=Herbaspirillum autotrophicum TaxID=180195 RepID=UPI00067CF6EE|nr:trehalose-phosphatase [Herbaspirillum autotrophicum]
MSLINIDCDCGSDALFLDFDGTLVDLAPRPESVLVPPQLIVILELLYTATGGALAIVSGRPLQQLDQFLAPLRLPAAGVHGVERRRADGTLIQLPVPDSKRLLPYIEPFAKQHPGLLLELKHGALALHYRNAPQLEAACVQIMAEALEQESGFALLHGKMVIEAKAAVTNKGEAIAAFMREAPFAGRRPVFAGDDLTDEAGFAQVQLAELDGIGIKIGAGDTRANARLADPSALREFLFQALPTKSTSIS